MSRRQWSSICLHTTLLWTLTLLTIHLHSRSFHSISASTEYVWGSKKKTEPNCPSHLAQHIIQAELTVFSVVLDIIYVIKHRMIYFHFINSISAEKRPFTSQILNLLPDNTFILLLSFFFLCLPADDSEGAALCADNQELRTVLFFLLTWRIPAVSDVQHSQVVTVDKLQ